MDEYAATLTLMKGLRLSRYTVTSFVAFVNSGTSPKVTELALKFQAWLLVASALSL